MKEYPILFSPPMVNAILDGRKTQTRRILNPQPDGFIRGSNGTFSVPKKITTKKPHKNGTIWKEEDGTCYEDIKCKYGHEGDRLWVRETFAEVGTIGKPIDWFEYQYKADFLDGIWQGYADMCFEKWKPSIHLPRNASRIMLEVESVRVERLHSISEKDAMQEGASDVLTRDDLLLFSELDPIIPRPFAPYQFGFMKIWLLINGVKSWNENPWVWAITFKNISHTHK